MPRPDVPSWLSAFVAILVLSGGILASWLDTREEITTLKAQRIEDVRRIAALEAKDAEMDRRFDDLRSLLIKVDTTLDVLRGRLGMGGD